MSRPVTSASVKPARSAGPAVFAGGGLRSAVDGRGRSAAWRDRRRV